MALQAWRFKYKSTVAIPILLHILLWGSLCTLIVIMDIFSVAYMDITLRPPAVLMLLSVSTNSMNVNSTD